MTYNLHATQTIDRAVKDPLENSAPTKNYWPIAVAIGIIVILTGVFLILAAHQILPHGINTISNLGNWGQVAGYGGFGMGAVIVLIGAIQWHLKNKMNEKNKTIPVEIDTNSSTIENNPRENPQLQERTVIDGLHNNIAGNSIESQPRDNNSSGTKKPSKADIYNNHSAVLVNTENQADKKFDSSHGPTSSTNSGSKKPSKADIYNNTAVLIGSQLRHTSSPVPAIKIAEETKESLDLLLGGQGVVDSLPYYPEILCAQPTLDNMRAPIMKGLLKDGRPFIALKMKCLSSKEEIVKKLKISEEKAKCLSFFKTEHLLLLYQYHNEGPLFWGGDGKYCWHQLQASCSAEAEPYFFTGNFTFVDTGEPADGQSEGFALLKTLIAQGQGEDLHGIKWQIIKV